MKYLMIALTLLLAGCSEKVDVDKCQRDATNVQILTGKLNKEKYLKTCYTHRLTGNTLIWKEHDPFVNSEDGLNLCAYDKVCDYKKSSKCVTSLSCFAWVRYDELDNEIIRRNMKVTECPK